MADEKPLTFEDLMSLQTLDSGEGEQGKEKFMSVRPAFSAGGVAGGAFGGHVYAQAVWAAAHTVGSGMVVHVSLSRDFVVSFLTILEGDGRRGC
jgi:acyl-CoA thioesterase